MTQILRAEPVERSGRKRPAPRPAEPLALFQGMAQLIAASADLAPALAAAARLMQEHLASDHVAVYLVEPGGSDLALCAVAGGAEGQIPPALYRVSLGEGTPGQAALAGRCVRVKDFSRHPGLITVLGLGRTHAEWSIPIREGDRVIGAFTLVCSDPSAIDGLREEHLLFLAEQLSAILRGAEALRRESERAARERLLTQIGRAVNSPLGLSQVLEHAVAEAGKGLKADRCALGQFDIHSPRLAVEHEYINPMLNERRSLKRSLAGSVEALARILQSGEVVACTEHDVHPALGEVWAELSGRYAIRSLAFIPIPGQSSDRFYCLWLMQATPARPWTEDDFTLLRGIADQLGLAMRNAQLFDAMQQAAAELEAKNAELEAFVYTVSHDLQSPVVSLRGFASLLQSRHADRLDERGRSYLSRIEANAEYLSRLLQDLLELSRVGRVEEPGEPVQVGSVVQEVLDELAQPLAQRAIRLALPEDWPEVRYSRIRLRQVFSNLLSNGIKFLGPQPRPRIELGWERLGETETTPGPAGEQGGPGASAAPTPPTGHGPWETRRRTSRIQFFVRDNGIGIHPDYHQRIFTPFQRLKELNVDGTGVGLSIVKRIVERRGGSVRVESAPGAGATFYFTVPEPVAAPIFPTDDA